MSLLKQREDAAAKALEIAELATAEERELTDEEISVINEKHAEVEALDSKIKAADEARAKLAALGRPAPRKDGETNVADEVNSVKSLGEHFVKTAGERLIAAKGIGGAVVSAPEFKAATDTHVVGNGQPYLPWLTEYDRTIVRPNRPRLVLADLLGKGSISGNAISYLVEGAGRFEGAFTTVAEGGAKPQVHLANPTAVVDSLKKIAGFIKLSDEMIEDLDFVVSEINGRLLEELAYFEESQLLSGNGTGSNLQGLLNRGIGQLEAEVDEAVADVLFRAMTKVSLDSGLSADGLVINPADYQALRLAKDTNEQYYGGGYFAGQYGNGGIMENPPVWGLRTVVSPLVAAGTALVGNFNSATVYRKGGVRVESTNSHASDFTNNLVTIRAEERIALAVRRPTAFVQVQLVNDGV